MSAAITQVKGKPFPGKYMDFFPFLCYNCLRENCVAKGSPAFFEVRENKRRYPSLLLLAGEREHMIGRYLDRGTMYALEDDGVQLADMLYFQMKVE